MAEEKIPLSNQNQINEGETEVAAPVADEAAMTEATPEEAVTSATEGGTVSEGEKKPKRKRTAKAKAEPKPDAEPKKRGRKKKADEDEAKVETLTPPSDADGELTPESDSFPTPNEPVTEDAIETEVEAVADEVSEPVEESEAIEAEDEPTIIEETEPSAEPVAAEDEVTTAEAEAIETESEAVADEVAEPVDESEAVEAEDEPAIIEEAAADTEEIDELTDATADSIESDAVSDGEDIISEDEGAVSNEEFILPSEFVAPTEDELTTTDSGFLNIEHFADLYDGIPAGEEAPSEQTADTPDESELPFDDGAEYENLTILEPEVEPERPRAEREVREPSPDDAPYNPKKQRGVDNRFDLVELFVFTLVIIMLITTFFFKHSVVEGSSMEGTLINGDHLIISDFLYTPKQYDIVVIHDPEAHADGPIVKRVIATGGQTVVLKREIDPERSTKDNNFYTLKVYVDGIAIRDDFVYYSGSDNIPIDYTFEDFELTFSNGLGEYRFKYVVPEGEVFVMGDHRNNSKDSREFGSVKEDTILGKVLIRIFPFDSFGTIE